MAAAIGERTFYRWIEKGKAAKRGQFFAFSQAVEQAEAKAEARERQARGTALKCTSMDKAKIIRDTAPADIYEKALTGEISVSKAAMLTD